MTDKDSEIVISPRVYKAALEAANINSQPISKFLEEAIRNQIEVRDEKKQMAILEKEIDIINKRTKLVRDKAYERLSKIEEELASYKQKYNKADSELIKLKKRKEKLDEDLKVKSDKLTITEEALNSYKKKYDAAFSELEKLKEDHYMTEEDLKVKTKNLDKLESSLNSYMEKYDEASSELENLKKEYKDAENDLKLNNTELDIMTKNVEVYKKEASRIKDLVAENKEINDRLKDTGIKLRVARSDIRKFKDKINEYMPGVNVEESSLNKIFSDIIKEKEELKGYKYRYEELRENSKKKYQLLAQNMPVGILIIKSKEIEFYNNYFYQMIGYRKKEFKNIWKVLTKSSIKKLKKQLNTKEERTTFELEANAKNKSKIYLEANLIRIQYSGKPGFILTLKDITHKKELGSSKTSIENMRFYLKEKDEEIAKLRSELEEREEELKNLGKQSKEIAKEKAKELEDLRKRSKEPIKEVPEELPEIKKEKPATKVIEKKFTCNAYIILTDIEGNISSLNHLVTSELGYKLEDFTDDEGSVSNIVELMATEKEKSDMKKWIKEINLSRKPVVNEVLFKDKQGKKKKFTLMMELIMDVDSEPIGLIHIFF